jgi:hypothetical protein
VTVVFTEELYWVACTLAGDARRGYQPRGVNLLTAEHVFPRLRKAVYFVVDRSGNIAYVGKVCRPGDIAAVESRIAEHVEDVTKASTWSRLYVIPLKVDTPNDVVEYVEGLVGERLEPNQNKRLPKTMRRALVAQPFVGGTAGAK